MGLFDKKLEPEQLKGLPTKIPVENTADVRYETVRIALPQSLDSDSVDVVMSDIVERAIEAVEWSVGCAEPGEFPADFYDTHDKAKWLEV